MSKWYIERHTPQFVSFMPETKSGDKYTGRMIIPVSRIYELSAEENGYFLHITDNNGATALFTLCKDEYENLIGQLGFNLVEFEVKKGK